MQIQSSLLNDERAARLLGLGVQTLRNWRHLSKGPAYCRMGRRCLYDVKDLEAYKTRCRVDPEAD